MEYNQFIKVISECPLDEALFIELLDAGSAQSLVQRLSLSNNEVITILESITRRALAVRGFETSGIFGIIFGIWILLHTCLLAKTLV